MTGRSAGEGYGERDNYEERSADGWEFPLAYILSATSGVRTGRVSTKHGDTLWGVANKQSQVFAYMREEGRRGSRAAGERRAKVPVWVRYIEIPSTST